MDGMGRRKGVFFLVFILVIPYYTILSYITDYHATRVLSSLLQFRHLLIRIVAELVMQSKQEMRNSPRKPLERKKQKI